MALIEWNESLSVGVKEIDFQHRRWIDMINAMDEALSAGGAEKLGQIKHESIKAMVGAIPNWRPTGKTTTALK
ncbi:MAG: hypothetical protein P8X55_09860 [Desulfosarcinaceae bacterium]